MVHNLPDSLEDLYLTGNKLTDYQNLLEAIYPLKDSLKVIYLDMNQIDGSVYIDDLFAKFPGLKQVDQTYKKKTPEYHGGGTAGVKSAMKKHKESSEMADAIEDVLKKN